MAISLSISACGGGGSGSSSDTASLSQPSTPTGGSNNTSNSPQFANTIEINPLRDLGLGVGDNVCFKIKAYNNVTESKFSGALCSTLKNETSVNLSWNDVPGNVVGYYVYYGTKKKDVNNFLVDVVES